MNMLSSLLKDARMDRTALSVIGLHDRSGELDYWLDQPPIKRLEGVELLRQIAYSYDPFTSRLPRVFEIIERSRS